MARVPARLQFRVQLRFVTEEQLFGAGPLSLPTPKSLQLDVHPAGEEADATVTDGEVPSPAGKLGPGVCEHNVRARGGGGARLRVQMCAECACALGRVEVWVAPSLSPPAGVHPEAREGEVPGYFPSPQLAQTASLLRSRTWVPRAAGP